MSKSVTHGQIQEAAKVLAQEAQRRLDPNGHITHSGWADAEAATVRRLSEHSGSDDPEFDKLYAEHAKWSGITDPVQPVRDDNEEDLLYRVHAGASGIVDPPSLRS